MITQTISKPVSIQDFVAELRKFPKPAFNQIDRIIRFLQNNPVVPDTLAPYLTWDTALHPQPDRQDSAL